MQGIKRAAVYVILQAFDNAADQVKAALPQGSVFAKYNSGVPLIWYKMRCYNNSVKHFFRAHELFSASDQLGGVAFCLNNIGNVYKNIGEFDTALLFFDESFVIYSNIQDEEGTIQALANKAAVLITGKRLKKAEKVLEIAERIAKKRKKPRFPFEKQRSF